MNTESSGNRLPPEDPPVWQVGSPEPNPDKNPLALPPWDERVRLARLKGYEAAPCVNCGALTLVRNGTDLLCETCRSRNGVDPASTQQEVLELLRRTQTCVLDRARARGNNREHWETLLTDIAAMIAKLEGEN